MLKSLLGKKEISDRYVHFESDLLKFNQKFKKYDKLISAAFPKKEITRNNLDIGTPLIIFTSLSFSQKALLECYQSLISIFTSHKIWTKNVSEWFEKKSNNLFIKKLAKAIISFDMEAIQKLAKTSPIPEATLVLLGRELIRPFFKSFAALASKVDSFDNWKEGFCPVCGNSPSLAKFSNDEEGKRYLWCSRCEFEWTFPRTTCTFCKNTDHTKLRFLTTNFRKELRIDVCEVCKGYIKTIDERKGDQEKKTDFFKENIASLYLDILAEDKGYLVQLPAVQETKIKFSVS